MNIAHNIKSKPFIYISVGGHHIFCNHNKINHLHTNRTNVITQLGCQRKYIDNLSIVSIIDPIKNIFKTILMDNKTPYTNEYIKKQVLINIKR